MLSVQSVIVQSSLCRDSFCDGIGFYQVSSSRLPITDDVFQFITAARRQRCCQYEALSVQSGLGRDSYLYGIGFSQVSSSRLRVNDDVFQFMTVARRKQCYQYKALSYNLVSVVIPFVTV